MKKILGIDVGITSVGWGIIDEEFKVIDKGVRLFEEQQITGNAERRAARSSRRITRRRKQRIIDMKKLLVINNFINEDFIPLDNPYEIRVRGLNNKLTNEELATILLQYAKRRGSSLETVEEVSKNELGTKSLLANNKKELNDKKFIANVQLSRINEIGKIRGHENVFKTSDYLFELKSILDNQDLDIEFKNKVINIVERRRHFSTGPGSLKTPTKYGRYREVTGELKYEIDLYLKKEYKDKYLVEDVNFKYKDINYIASRKGSIVNRDPYDLIALMRGKCSLYPDELRAPKNSFSAELFNLLNDLNNLKFLTREEEKITKEEKEEIIKIVREKGNITVNGILKLLNVTENEVKGFRENKSGKPIISEFPGYKKILNIINDLNEKIFDDFIIDNIMEILTETLIEEERYERINKILNNKKLTEKLSQLTGINEYHSLSLKAIRELNTEMLEDSLNQQEIITNNNLKTNKVVKKLVADESAILSPTAKRAHREAVKVIAELINEHGNFDRIIIETTRSKNSADEQKRINDIQKYFENSKREAESILGDYGKENANSKTITKLRLYKEQNGKCAYSGRELDIATIIRDPLAYEIDHIIPLSISFDDSYNNKVLILPIENQNKGNTTPYYYFLSGRSNKSNEINSWEKFESSVNQNNNISKIKKQNLLFMKDITKYDTMREFINRNLIDTSYAVRSLMETLKSYFAYNNIDTKVLTIKGKQTSIFRKLGLNNWYKANPKSSEVNPFKKDREFYRHHAIDALIIAALANQKTIKAMYNLVVDDNHVINDETGEIVEVTEDSKINMFLKEISKIKDEEIKFSWKIDTKPNRKVSDQTIYSTRLVKGEHVIINTLENIYELENKKLEPYLVGVNKNKLLVSKHDPKTFEIIKNAYLQYQHEKYPLKVFKDNHGFIRKYSKNNNGPIVKNLKFEANKLGNHIDITPSITKERKVILLTLSNYRADIYLNEHDNSYKFVTIKQNDINQFGDKYSIDNKWYEEQLKIKKITNDYKFMFSLYKNDLLSYGDLEKREVYNNLLKFVGINHDEGNKLEFKLVNKVTPSNARIKASIGKKTLWIYKYNISPAGKISKVTKEDLKLEF